ncbi:hypothetical protein ACSQ76_12290 [Roseovarius sp. B08]|uniref:hypothetical protein n=1 Tax=Roseovarius sp. B08 TaxID=3449223 RepID=UPI003EDCB050
MAKKPTKKADVAADDQAQAAPVVAFEYFERENEATGETLQDWRRLELSEDEFEALPADTTIHRGVFVEMLTGIEGGRFSLKPGQKQWIPPHAYEEWKAKGKCKPTDDDPQVLQALEDRGAAMRAAQHGEAQAVAKLEAARAALHDMQLTVLAARDALQSVREALQAARERLEADIADDDAVTDPKAALKDVQEVQKDLQAVLKVLPDVVMTAPETDGDKA